MGKTTLCESLLEERYVPGLKSQTIRGDDGLPREICLTLSTTGSTVSIGKREEGPMQPRREVLDAAAVKMALTLSQEKSDWVYVDEIGFLEEASIRYQQALWQLFETKQVLAVLRKGDYPFLNRLRAREDICLLDLDRQEEWK